jgi:hypothetical protein
MGKLWDQLQRAEASVAHRPKSSVAPQVKAMAPKPSAPNPATGSPTEVKAKRGRPRIEDKGKTLSDAKPWVAAGMSRSSWYLRRKSPK